MNIHSHTTNTRFSSSPSFGNLLSFPAAVAPDTNQAWTVEAEAQGMVLTISPAAELDSKALTSLTEAILEARAAGLSTALVCADGAAREMLETIHFHRFVEIFDTAQVARRWLSIDGAGIELRRAA